MAERYDEIPLAQLQLDKQNPRLPRHLTEQDRQPDRLIEHVAKAYNLLEIARSMADKGFMPRHAEALLVVEEPVGSSKFTVVEGNRRLATIMLLTNQGLRNQLSLPTEWDELEAEAEAKGHSFDPVPVVIYDSREQLEEYLGFRHITGPAQWRPEAKARYVAMLLRDGRPVRDVARRIGTTPHIVRRFAEAHSVFEQALLLGLDVTAVEAGFGIFYNALNTPGIRAYLGLGPPRNIEELPVEPIKDEHLGDLASLINLLYGDDDQGLEKVILESRELKKLSDVLQDKEAASILLRTRDLNHAYAVAGGGKTELLESLKETFVALVEANGKAFEFKDDPEVKAQVERLTTLVLDLAFRYDVEPPK